MKHLLVITLALMLGGCGKGLTRLMPKIEKIDLPEELMKPPQELKIIVKPDPPPAANGDATPGNNTAVTPKR
jgi:hypothetical protein